MQHKCGYVGMLVKKFYPEDYLRHHRPDLEVLTNDRLTGAFLISLAKANQIPHFRSFSREDLATAIVAQIENNQTKLKEMIETASIKARQRFAQMNAKAGKGHDETANPLST